MKKILFVVNVVGLLLISCNSNEKKALEFSEQFATNVKNDNLEWLKSVYPTADFDSIGFSDYAVPTIGESHEKGVIRIDFGPASWIDVEHGNDDSFVVINSHGIAAFPEYKMKIAEETGMITKDMPDMEIQKRISDNRFFNWIKTKMYNIISIEPGPFVRETYTNDDGIYTLCNCKVTNNSSVPISGKDYTITYIQKLNLPNYYPSSSRGNKNGVDLNPGETKTITIKGYGNKLENIAVELNIPEEKLAGLVKPTGNEYAEFIKLYGEPQPIDRNAPATPSQCLAVWQSKMPTNGSIDQFAWLSSYELKRDELTGFSKADLRILQNAIFALHGYIFKSEDLRNYFSNFSGYTPTTNNVKNFNKIENANIQLIQSME